MPSTIVRVSAVELPRLEQLIRGIESEQRPQDEQAATRAVEGLHQALGGFDSFNSHSFWILAAGSGGRFVGYAAVARVPKADARAGFLWVDELYVLRDHRRQGHAHRLLEETNRLAGEQSLAGVRLLVAVDNVAGRSLYKHTGMVESDAVLCQRRV